MLSILFLIESNLLLPVSCECPNIEQNLIFQINLKFPKLTFFIFNDFQRFNLSQRTADPTTLETIQSTRWPPCTQMLPQRSRRPVVGVCDSPQINKLKANILKQLHVSTIIRQTHAKRVEEIHTP